MNRTAFPVCSLIVGGLLAPTAAAQKVELEIAPAKNTVLEYTITSTADITTERKTLIDGEERAGRGGRGGRGGVGGGPSKSAQKLVIHEGPAGSNWRKYVAAEGSITRAGRDGEDQTTKIDGALAGKKVFISVAGDQVVLKESADGEPLPRQTATGVPASMDLSGLLPGKAIELKGKYELGQDFITALKILMQPVQAAGAAGGRGQRGARQQGGRRQAGDQQGGRQRGARQQGARQQGARQQGARQRGAGQQRFGRGGSTFNDTALNMLNSPKLAVKGTGELVSIEGNLATIAIHAVIAGKGTPEELGLSRARGGRAAQRGGRGAQRGGGGGFGGGGQAQNPGKASLTIEVKGTVVVDQGAHRIQAVELAGSVQSMSETTRTMAGRGGGDERKFETKESTQGKFKVAVQCADKGAPKDTEKAAEVIR